MKNKKRLYKICYFLFGFFIEVFCLWTEVIAGLMVTLIIVVCLPILISICGYIFFTEIFSKKQTCNEQK